MTVSLADHELDLLERLVAAYEQDREELFVAVYTSAGTVIKHKGLRGQSWGNDGAALAGLDAARLLLVQSENRGRPQPFYLANNAPEELAAMRQAAEEAARAEAEQAAADRAAGHEPLSLAEALERMIGFHKAQPGGMFTPYDTRPNPSIGYSGRAGEPPLPLTHGEFARLLTSGALVRRGGERSGVYYLTPEAGDILAAEQRLQSEGPLATAERRIAAVETRRGVTAEWAGRVAGVALVLLLVYLVVNREQLFPPGAAAGTVYEILTVAFGVTGLAAGFVAYRLVRAGVAFLLTRWLDPEAGGPANRR